MKGRVQKWGNSLAVRIPRLVAEDARIREGDPVEMAVGADGVVSIRRTDDVPPLDDLVAGITPENRHSQVSAGTTTGKESVEW